MLPVGFEPTFSAGERQKTYTLDRAGNGTGHFVSNHTILITSLWVKITFYIWLEISSTITEPIQYTQRKIH